MSVLIDSKKVMDVISKAYKETKEGGEFLGREDALLIISEIKSDLADLVLDAVSPESVLVTHDDAMEKIKSRIGKEAFDQLSESAIDELIQKGIANENI